MAQGRSTLLLQRQSMPCWSNGIIAGTMGTARTEIILTIQHYEASNSFGGVAESAQRCTAGRLGHFIEPHHPKSQQDALVVLGRRFASATLWRLSVLTLLLILTLSRMVSLLLK